MKTKNLTIRRKLFWTIIGQLVLVALLIFFIIFVNVKLSSLTNEQAEQNRQTYNLIHFSQSMKDYLAGEISYEQLNEKYSQTNMTDTTELLAKQLFGTWNLLSEVKQYREKNQDIEKEVMELTDYSIEQSNQFINEVSQKLADPNLRNTVSTVERLVIAGANMNTSSNYQIKVLFHRLKDNIKNKEAIIDYLDKSVKNALKDEKNLAGTDFEELPKNAKKANLRIKDLVMNFTRNVENINRLNDEIFDRTNALVNHINQQANDRFSSVFSLIQYLLLIIFSVLLIISVILIFLNYGLSKTITGFLSEMLTTQNAISSGDLTRKIQNNYLKRSDELGKLSISQQKTVEKIRQIVNKIIEGAENVSSASKEMSSIANQVSSGSSQQAASTEEVSSSMEEMAASIKQNADNAQQTERIATQAEKSMEIIKTSANDMAEALKNIVERISIINEIAEKTDLLAINAAVEAARAGEHGKGFAVVAGEVRKLAERSQKAANEIDEVSQSSVKMAAQSSRLISEVIPDIQNTARLVQEITASSLEQNSGIEQVNNAVQQLASVTEENATSSEEMAGSAELLSKQAEQLRKTITFFKTSDRKESLLSTDEIDRQIQFLMRLKSDNQSQTEDSTEKEVDIYNEQSPKEQSEQTKAEKQDGFTIDMNEDDDNEFETFKS